MTTRTVTQADTFEFDTVNGSTYVVDRTEFTITRKPGLRPPVSGEVDRRPHDFEPQPLLSLPEVVVGQAAVCFVGTTEDIRQLVTTEVTDLR